MDTKSIVESAADNFLMRYEGSKGGGSVQNQYDSHDFLPTLQSELYKYKRSEDKLIFLHRSIVAVDKERDKDHKGGFVKKYYDSLVYFVQQEIDELNAKDGSAPDYFTTQERVDILSAIEELKNTMVHANEILFNELEDLKSQLHQKKKTFYDVAKGKVFDWVVNKVTDPETISNFYYKIIDKDLPTLLSQ